MKQPRAIPAADRAVPVAIAHMNCARILLPVIPLAKPFRTILRVLIILLVAIVVLYMLVVLLGKRQPRGRDGLDRRLDWPALPVVNRSSTMPHYVPGMDETQTVAAQALREPPALWPDIFTRPSALLARR